MNEFDGLDMTGWTVDGTTARRGLRDGCRHRVLGVTITRSGIIFIDDGSNTSSSVYCTDLIAAYTLANQIAEATGGWKE